MLSLPGLARMVALLACLIGMAGAPAAAAGRVALVIGNSAYVSQPALPNPVNDAADLAQRLRELGFEVEERTDLGHYELIGALREFQRRALGAEVALIYYSGHGMEIDRANYLIPVDARLETDRDVAFEAVPLDVALLAADGATQLSLVIVDACRDNPFLQAMRRTVATRAISRGLAGIETTGNSLVAFAAKEGTVAYDGSGRNSPYAAALIAALGEPGLEIGKLFRHVRDRVIAETAGAQEPFLYGSLSAEDFFFRPPEPVPEPVPEGVSAAPEPAPAPAPAPAGDAYEIAFWSTIAGSADPRDFEDYLRRYPEGAFVSLATRRLDALGSGARAAVTPVPPAPEAVPAPAPEVVALAPATGPEPVPERVPERLPEPAPEAVPEPFTPSRDEVRGLQERLSLLGYDPGPSDGLTGRRTTAAVSAYQRDRGLAADGVIGRDLLARLAAEVPEATLARWREERRAAAAAAAASRAARTPRREPEPQPERAPEPEPAALPLPVPQTAPAPAVPLPPPVAAAPEPEPEAEPATGFCLRSSRSDSFNATQDCE